MVESHRLGYLSPAGHYVWREAAPTSQPLNLDCMRRATYLAASAPQRRYAGLGGWGQSGNQARNGPQSLAPTATATVAVAL